MKKSKKAVKKKKRQAGDNPDQEENEDANKNGAYMKSEKTRNNKKASSYTDDVADDDEDESDSEDNSFKSDHREQMRQMDQMFMDPFGGFGGGMLALPQPSSSDRRRQQQQAQNMQMAERSMFVDPFAHFGSMFSNMRSMMTDMHRAFDQVSTDPNAHVYQQQSFMSYSNTGRGAPKLYQASSSTRQGPGGVKETRKAVRDSETGVEKISVGHHINDRAHIIEKGRNAKTGEQNDNTEYVNLDEEEAQPFDQEYQEKWRTNMAMRGIEPRRRGERSRHASLTGDSPYHRTRHAALPEPPRNRKSSSSRRE